MYTMKAQYLRHWATVWKVIGSDLKLPELEKTSNPQLFSSALNKTISQIR